MRHPAFLKRHPLVIVCAGLIVILVAHALT
jgi:hypothetical protein